MTSVITLPGIDGSGPDHWQTHWEQRDRAFQRFQPSSWSEPDLTDWIVALDRAVLAQDEAPLLVAHSLACLLLAHWSHPVRQRVRGAFLVSVPDPDGPRFPRAASSFRDPPTSPLPFPALVIASSDDPYGSLDHAQRRAGQWGASILALGQLGHINEASGLASWPQGAQLFEAFRAGVRW